jgi:hypothetical protein
MPSPTTSSAEAAGIPVSRRAVVARVATAARVMVLMV